MRFSIISSALHLLPATVLSFVILPQASVFSEPQAPSLIRVDSNQYLQHSTPQSVRKAGGDDDDDDTPLPVIIWHGLGDSADAKGLNEIADLVNSIHPGTYTYVISLSGQGPGTADRQTTFFGNVTDQISLVCNLLAQDPILSTAPAVDAIGFSQGGQFLRGYVERCSHLPSAPNVRSLITFGSQHNGIAEFQRCASPTDWVCLAANALLKSRTVWSSFVQSRLVPAQYYRDTNDYESYLNHSNFLADINNERKEKNATYAKNLASLKKFVMVVFKDDVTVIPRESGWFAEVNVTESKREITSLRNRTIYTEDWIGLKKLDSQGGLVFEEIAGQHMELKDKELKRLFTKYFGPEGKKFEDNDVDGEILTEDKFEL